MTKVYLIRHAEAEGNLYRRAHGHYNSNLTKLGVKQLDALEKRFEGIHIDKVYSSDLRRTFMTSTAVTRSRGMTADLTPQLREVCFGVWEDMEWGNIERYFRDQLINFSSYPVNWKVEGSESFYAAQERMIKTVIEKAAKHNGETIVLVSHAVAIRALTAKLKGIDPHEISKLGYFNNASVTVLDVEGDSIDLIEEGSSSHLTEEYTRPKRKKVQHTANGLNVNNLRFERAGSFDASLLKALSGDANILPENSFIAFRGDEPIGSVSVDTESRSSDGTGIMSNCFIVPEWRGENYLPQFIGKAVSESRKRNLTSLSAHICDDDVRDKFIHLGMENRDEAHPCELTMDIKLYDVMQYEKDKL